MSDEVQVGLVGGNVVVSFIDALLDEDEPGLRAVGGCRVDGSLYGGVVARAVLGHYGVVEPCLGLLALQGGEVDGDALKGIAAAVGDEACGKYEGVVGVVFQSAVGKDGCLAADGGRECLAVERGVALCGHNLLVEVENDGARS